MKGDSEAREIQAVIASVLFHAIDDPAPVVLRRVRAALVRTLTPLGLAPEDVAGLNVRLTPERGGGYGVTWDVPPALGWLAEAFARVREQSAAGLDPDSWPEVVRAEKAREEGKE